MGLLSDIWGLAQGIQQNKQAKSINPEYHPYEKSPYAGQQLGIAEQLFNGRMPGAVDEERNILASQGDFLANVSRNATDSGQALALAALSQGQTNSAFNKLGQQEAGYKASMLDNLNKAYGVNINEGDKIFQDQWQKYLADTEQKMYYKNAASQNIFGSLKDLGSTAFSAGELLNSKKGGDSGLGSALQYLSLAF